MPARQIIDPRGTCFRDGRRCGSFSSETAIGPLDAAPAAARIARMKDLSPVAAKGGHRRAKTFRPANFSDTQIFESNLIGPGRYARQVGKGRLANVDRPAPASQSSVRAHTLPRPLSYRRRDRAPPLPRRAGPCGPPPPRLTLFSFCSMLGQGWQWPKPEMMSRRKAPSFPRQEASVLQ